MKSKKLKSIWKCKKCNCRIKRITGEKFEKPKECECGSREFE